MLIKRTHVMLLLLVGIISLTFVAACASSSTPASQPTVLSVADKAAMEAKAAMEKAVRPRTNSGWRFERGAQGLDSNAAVPWP